MTPHGDNGAGMPGMQPGMQAMEEAMRQRYAAIGGNGANPNVANPYAPPPAGVPPDASATAPADATNQISKITIMCRAVSLSSISPSANTDIAFTLQNELKNSQMFDPAKTQLSPQITPDETTSTFTFAISVELKQPLKF
jgi:hypothetical protein